MQQSISRYFKFSKLERELYGFHRQIMQYVNEDECRKRCDSHRFVMQRANQKFKLNIINVNKKVY